MSVRNRTVLLLSQLLLVSLLQACGGGDSGASTTSGAAASNASATADRSRIRNPQTHMLTVSSATGGAVSGVSGAINCGTACTTAVNNGAAVTLNASAKPGYAFKGWGGACSGTVASCKLTMTTAQTVSATFAAATDVLTVTSATGGTVSSSPSGISCGSTCSASYAQGTSVVLSAVPATGYTFSGWSGACSGTATTCTVALSAAATAGASFTATTASNPPAGTSACAQTSSSWAQTVTPGGSNGYAYTQFGNYSVQVDDWGNMPGTTVVWANSPSCWGTSITQSTDQYNIPVSPEVSRGWTANASVMQNQSTAGYPNAPNWTTLSGLGIKVSDLTKAHVKWAMSVPTTPNPIGTSSTATVNRWDALLDVYFFTTAQGAPNPPASVPKYHVDLEIYQMLNDQPLSGQQPQYSSYWAGSFLYGNNPFVKTIGGVRYVGVIDAQSFNETGGHTISLFVTPTAFTDSSTNGGTTTTLWGQANVTHDLGSIIAWLSQANPTDDSGNPLKFANNSVPATPGATVTSPLIDPSVYLSSINGYFELDFGTTGNNAWKTTDFWVSLQNEPDGN